MSLRSPQLHPAADSLQRSRIELAAAYRIAAREGMGDGVFTHFSLSIPGTADRFLLKPHGLLFSEVTASNLIVVDLAGKLVEGTGMWEPTAFYIHSCIHKAVPGAACVLHTHMPYATALSNLSDSRLLPINQSCVRFWGRIAYYNEYNGLALDPAEGDRIVAALASHDVLMMANHGVTVVGPSVADALFKLYYLEIACRDQWLTLAMNKPLRPIPDAVAQDLFDQFEQERHESCELHLAAMMRQLDHDEPNYKM